MTTTLDRLGERHPPVRGAIDALRLLLGAMRELEARLPAGIPSREAASTRLREGIPALAGEPLLTLDELLAHADVIASRLTSGGLNASATSLARLRRTHGAWDPDVVMVSTLNGDWEALRPLRKLGIEVETLAALLDYAVRPTLRAATERLREEISQAHWERGYCPACGAIPVLAELRPGGDGVKDASARVLRCGRCASAWSFPRLRCHRCGERDHRKLGFLHAADEQEYRRADRCESCRGYLKALAVLAPLSAEALLEEDLATSGLDLMAIERGYRR